jgi:hypothetical protein
MKKYGELVWRCILFGGLVGVAEAFHLGTIEALAFIVIGSLFIQEIIREVIASDRLESKRTRESVFDVEMNGWERDPDDPSQECKDGISRVRLT